MPDRFVHPKSTAGWTDRFKNPITGIHTLTFDHDSAFDESTP